MEATGPGAAHQPDLKTPRRCSASYALKLRFPQKNKNKEAGRERTREVLNPGVMRITNPFVSHEASNFKCHKTHMGGVIHRQDLHICAYSPSLSILAASHHVKTIQQNKSITA